MAYDLKYLTRHEQTNNLDKSLNVKAGMDMQTGPQMWSYNATAAATGGSNDSKATVVTAHYFSPAWGYLSVYDLIWVSCSDGASLLAVKTVVSATDLTTESLADTT